MAAEIFSWLENNWFALLQSIGIVGGLAFTGLSSSREAKSRRVSDLLSLTSHHRELWAEVQHRPELHRILKGEVDLVASPISTAEEEFLNLVLIHFQTGYLLAKENAVPGLDGLELDAKNFFSLPLPNAVWKQKRPLLSRDFAAFLDKALL